MWGGVGKRWKNGREKGGKRLKKKKWEKGGKRSEKIQQRFYQC